MEGINLNSDDLLFHGVFKQICLNNNQHTLNISMWSQTLGPHCIIVAALVSIVTAVSRLGYFDLLNAAKYMSNSGTDKIVVFFLGTVNDKSK